VAADLPLDRLNFAAKLLNYSLEARVPTVAEDRFATMTHIALLPDHTPDSTVSDLTPWSTRADDWAAGRLSLHRSPDPDADDVFPQSVASGGPTADGVVLWTRLEPSVHDVSTPLRVVVVPAAAAETDGGDVAGAAVVAGDLPAGRVEPTYDYTVRLDLSGALEPDTDYLYQFSYDGVHSRVGRCRTLPAPDANPASVRLAVVSCQDYLHGYFGAFSHIAAEEVDFLVHLGDFIYEATDGRFGGLGSPDLPDRQFEFPSGEPVAHSLADFRTCHRVYRTDRHLQRALEAHTLVAGWDDHGVANNRYWDAERDAPVLPDHPRGDDPQFATQLTADGVRAWYEYTPARVEYHPGEEHLHDQFRLYRHLRFGNLAAMALTDERFYRNGPPDRSVNASGVRLGRRRVTDPDRTMLGADQSDWLLDWFRGQGTDVQWTVWLNAVLSVPLRVGAGPLTAFPKHDAWDGFAAERDAIVRTAGEEARNFVTITGDMHSYVAARQAVDTPGPLRALARRLRGDDPVGAVGVELMTPAVTSVNLAEVAGVQYGLAKRLTRPVVSGLLRAMNPHWEFVDSHHWGYTVVEFSKAGCDWTAYAVDKLDEHAEKRLLHRLHVRDGSTKFRRPAS
jgi:alkaline phosphatase D